MGVEEKGDLVTGKIDGHLHAAAVRALDETVVMLCPASSGAARSR